MQTLQRLAPISLALLLLGTACSSSSSDPDDDDVSSTISGSEPTVDVATNDPLSDSPGTDDAIVTGPDTDLDTDAATDPSLSDSPGTDDAIEPTIDPDATPEPIETPAPAPEPTPDPVLEPEQDPTTGPAPDPTPDPITGPLPDPEPIPELTAETLEELGVPNIQNNAEVQAFADLLEQTVAFGLVDLNEKIQTGEPLTAAESECLNGFDTSSGDALLSIECGATGAPLENGVFAFSLLSAGLAQTPACNDGLLGLDGSACLLTSASVSIPAEFTTDGFGIPFPFPNGFVDFNITPGTLEIENLPAPILGNFDCSFDFATGDITSEGFIEDCAGALTGLAGRVQVWLDRRASF